MMPGQGPFKVLTLDGGGLRGAFTAAVLTVFEEHAQRPLLEYFDLVVGTSTGGIIALALAGGVPCRDMREFYRVDGPTIFPRGLQSAWRALAGLWRSKHGQTELRVALQRVLGQRVMRQLRTRVVVPTFSATAGQIRLFKTPHHPRIHRDGDRSLVDVALATSAAPYYLPEAVGRDERFVDGGLWANNPIAVGVVEAVGYLGVPPSNVRVLSIGTTTAPYHVRVGAIRRGLAGLFGARPVELVLAAQMSGAHAMAKVLLGGDGHLFRIDPNVAPGRFALDRARDLPELLGLGENAGTHALPRAASEFLDAPARYPFKLEPGEG